MYYPVDFMQREHSESSQLQSRSSNTSDPAASSQHGFLQHELSSLHRVRSTDSGSDSRSASPRSVGDRQRDSVDGVDADKLDEKLRGLSLRGKSNAARRRLAAGQRISDHENALTPPTPRQALGFKVIRRRSDSSDGTQLTDFPNGEFSICHDGLTLCWIIRTYEIVSSGPLTCHLIEILTHILSHLHPDSHASVALVSKRFYALVTTPHAWRMAFMRYFPGHTYLDTRTVKNNADLWADSSSDFVRSDIRYFGRVTPLATWRSEYLFRTRLMRSLARGKPGTTSGGIGASGGTSKSAKKKSAVLTYNSKLPWLVTNIHAVFTNGKKPPRAIQGSSDLGAATVSDPTTGKIEKWGLEDPFMAMQMEEVVPNIVPYGLSDGPLAVPNVMDVSQPYGVLAGEGFPGGRAHFRGVSEASGRYLGGDTGVVDTYPDVPKIPEMWEAICSVWIAKSSAVPAVTQSMCGILTGSALGIVTAYSLGWDPSGPRYANGDMTARWVLSPGVPIVSLKVDDNFNVKRKSSKRVWAVALNALGEVYYLAETPATALNRANGDDVTRHAWLAGRTAYWQLLESTRRVARPDELDKNVVRGAYSPRSPSNDMDLSKEQLAAEAREIEKFLKYRPSHFRKVCEGWDMRRRLEVDFANDDGHGAGESVFVVDCGLDEDTPARVLRYSRSLTATSKPLLQPLQQPLEDATMDQQPSEAAPARVSRSSLFGSAANATSTAVNCQTPEPVSPRPPPPTPTPTAMPAPPHGNSGQVGTQSDWQRSVLELKGSQRNATITATCLDCSSPSLTTLGEDALYTAEDKAPGATATASAAPTPTTKLDQSATEIPGRRARFLAVGTSTGGITVWNGREKVNGETIEPLRIMQTDSPEVSCLAASSLYLVHGGSDGLVQAWDPLASTLDPIRTLNSRSNGRVPRHMMTMNPTLREGNYSAVGAIYLDPNPIVLRGVLSFGAFLRYWTYSSAGHPAGRKRRARHSDVHGRVASRRLGGAVSGYIAAEEAELRRENEQRAREQSRLRKRFGVGALGDLTEEEALRYAQMVSEEAYLQEELRRGSDSAADASIDTASSFSETTADTVTPEPSVTDVSPPLASVTEDDNDNEESDFEQQIQQAIRLSLLEGVNDLGQSPRGNSSGEFEYAIKYKTKAGGSRKDKHSGSAPSSPSNSTPINGTGSTPAASRAAITEDEDLAIALSLSMQEEETKVWLGEVSNDFPPLETEGVGKGKGVRRW